MAGFRIVLAGGGTGGHLVPALNLARALRRADPDARLLLVGAERGVERSILPGSGFSYRLLPMEPLYRSRPWRNWRLLRSAPAVAAGLAKVFRELDPQLVVGTGGYASGPAVVWGRLSGRRTALQEQNAWPGLVTRWLARHVDQLHLGWPEVADRLRPGRRTVVFAHGNPVAPPGQPPRLRYSWPSGRVVAVLGGSQGARSLNRILLADLEEGPPLPPGTSLVWIAGPAHAGEVRERAGALPFGDRVRVEPFIPELGAQLERVTLAVSRAGAMQLSELAAAGVPAVLVPLPGSAGGHQSYNASALEEVGAALRLEEEALRPGKLWGAVYALLEDAERRRAMAEAMRARGRPHAAERIAADLLALAASSGGRREPPGAEAGGV